MRWIGISGSWRAPAHLSEKQVRQAVHSLMERGDGLVSGGAVGVDSIALDEALKYDPRAERIKIYLVSTLEAFTVHVRKRATQGIITHPQAEELIAQIVDLKRRNPGALSEKFGVSIIDKVSYYARNSEIVNAADELLVFRVITDASVGAGTSDMVGKAKRKGIPVEVIEKDLRSRGTS
jgi:hypothetical protein